MNDDWPVLKFCGTICLFSCAAWCCNECKKHNERENQQQRAFFATLPRGLQSLLIRIEASTLDGLPVKPVQPPALSEAEFQAFEYDQIQSVIARGYISNSLRQNNYNGSAKTQ